MPTQKNVPTHIYNPEIFNVTDIDAAKKIILTDEGVGRDTESRWSLETPYFGELIGHQLGVSSTSLVLDYGCGIGRLAKELIKLFGCRVIGVDISPGMRKLADEYVSCENFFAVSPDQLDFLLGKGLKADMAIAVWVLQHCLNPAADLSRIKNVISPGGRFFVANMATRAIPTRRADTHKFNWVSDGVDVWALLKGNFEEIDVGEIDQTRCPAPTSETEALWGTLRARG